MASKSLIRRCSGSHIASRYFRSTLVGGRQPRSSTQTKPIHFSAIDSILLVPDTSPRIVVLALIDSAARLEANLDVHFSIPVFSRPGKGIPFSYSLGYDSLVWYPVTSGSTQPGLAMKKGRCGTMTHDYKRNGPATLFAALDALEGEVISMCDDRHRHQEWLKFLRVIDDIVPSQKQIHMIVDNYATHKHPKVERWLARHPRFHMHFTPTGCSWLNMVERFFRDLTENRLRRGVFRCVEELITAIFDYIDHHNESPKPFIWTAKAADILEKVKRARAAQNNRQSA